MNCRSAMERLTGFLAGVPSETERAAPPADVLEHIARCPRCIEDLAAIGAVLGDGRSELLDDVYGRAGCTLVEQLLPEWVAVARAGGSPGDANPAAWRHLESCDRCRGSLAELRDLDAAAAAGEFGPLPDATDAAPPSNDARELLPRLLDGITPGALANATSRPPADRRAFAVRAVLQEILDRRGREDERARTPRQRVRRGEREKGEADGVKGKGRKR